MDGWKTLTALSVVLIIVISGYLAWTFTTDEEIALTYQAREVSFEGQTTHISPAYKNSVNCFEEAKIKGLVSTNPLGYSCTVEYWAEPYIRGAEITSFVKDERVGAIYHHRCTCTFEYLE